MRVDLDDLEAGLRSGGAPAWLDGAEAPRLFSGRPSSLDGLVPGTPEHKAARWEAYEARGGRWEHDRWSAVYDENVVKAGRSHRAVEEFRDAIGWGETQVRQSVEIDGEQVTRVLDIADMAQRRAVEHKMGYAYMSDDIRRELRADGALVDDGWDIRWSFDTEPSAPLRAELEARGIAIEIRK